MRNIFRVRIKEGYDEKELQKKRKRILRLCYTVLSEIGSIKTALVLAPDVTKILQKAGINETGDLGLKAVYIKTITEE